MLSRVKLVAEPWDARPDGYQLGGFPRPFAEWNDRFRDATRRFWRGDPVGVAELATRLAGSEDVFGPGARPPQASVNFATCHDGITLEDLVSYAHKHNEANLEANRDGAHESFGASWGVEGPSDDPRIVRARERTKRNLVATLAFALGVPMLSHGDELSRTQRGNNNAYCQDNELTWLDWSLDPRRERFLHFVQRAFALRRANPVFARERFFGHDDVTWLGADGAPLDAPTDWKDPDAARARCPRRRRAPARERGREELPVHAACAAAAGRAGARCSRRPASVRGCAAARARIAPHACLWLGAEPGPHP